MCHLKEKRIIGFFDLAHKATIEMNDLKRVFNSPQFIDPKIRVKNLSISLAQFADLKGCNTGPKEDYRVPPNYDRS